MRGPCPHRPVERVTTSTNNVSSVGYGAAGTYFILSGLQAKLSYEKAYRLPTNEELFGDEDLELGKIGLNPEKSDNLNFNLSYNRQLGKHGLYVETGLIYRNTSDYIYRSIETTSNRSYGSYSNYGSVETKGYPRVIITPAGSVSAETLHKWTCVTMWRKRRPGRKV